MGVLYFHPLCIRENESRDNLIEGVEAILQENEFVEVADIPLILTPNSRANGLLIKSYSGVRGSIGGVFGPIDITYSDDSKIASDGLLLYFNVNPELPNDIGFRLSSECYSNRPLMMFHLGGPKISLRT